MAESSPAPTSPAAETAADVLWTRRFWTLWIGVLLVRLAYATIFPLDLVPDESYYWDWGRRLDLGYYSKPPMIGWLMGLAGWLGGNAFVVLKMFPAILVAGGTFFVFQLGRSMFGARAGFWSAALILATPANAALSIFFTIDAPLFLFWSASLWLAWEWWQASRSRSADRGAWKWTVALLVSLGCGFLTKQIHLLFLVFLLAFVAVSDPRWLARGRLYAMILGSLLFLAPPLLWNWQHDWITFRHTAEELQSPVHSLRRSLRLFGEFLGGQAGLGGGVTWLGLVTALVIGLRRWKAGDDRHRFLLLFSVPGWLAFVALSFFQRVEQNWPLVFYVAPTVLLAAASDGALAWARLSPRWRSVGASLGALLALALMAVPLVLPQSRWGGSRPDPTARARGWKELAKAVEAYRGRLERPDRTFLLAPDDRYVASSLAYYLPDRPRTYCWEYPDRPESQYGIWGRPLDKVGWDALVIARNPLDTKVADVADRFGSWESLGEIHIPLGARPDRDRRYRVFLGRDFRPQAPFEVGKKGGESGLVGPNGAIYPVEFQGKANNRIDTWMQVFRFHPAGSRIAHLGAQL